MLNIFLLLIVMNSTLNIVNYFPFNQNIKLASYDGTLIFWKKIEHYRRQKENSVRGRQMSIHIRVYSDPFYRSKSGHTFPCQYGQCIFMHFSFHTRAFSRMISRFFSYIMPCALMNFDSFWTCNYNLKLYAHDKRGHKCTWFYSPLKTKCIAPIWLI